MPALANIPGTTPGTDPKTQFNGFFLIIAWLTTIILIVLFSKTKIGYTILMYFCIISIILVLAIGSPTITSIFNSAKAQ